MISLKTIASALAIYLLTMSAVIAQDQQPDISTASGMLEFAYSTMVKADLDRDAGSIDKALEGYKRALSGFITVSHKYPELDPEVVKFRMTYCDNQIETLMRERGVNGSRLPETPEERDSMSPSPVQTATASADGLSIQLREIREMISKRELTESRSALISLLKQTPDDPEIRMLMATVQCMLGRFDDADNMMTTLIQEKPELTRAYAVLSTAKIGLGEIEAARSALNKAIELGSASSEVYYNLTQIILATTPLDADAARTAYKRSLQLGGRRDPDLDYLLK